MDFKTFGASDSEYTLWVNVHINTPKKIMINAGSHSQMKAVLINMRASITTELP